MPKKLAGPSLGEEGTGPNNTLWTPAKYNAVRPWMSPSWCDETETRAWATDWVTTTARTRWPSWPVTDQVWVDSVVSWVLAA